MEELTAAEIFKVVDFIIADIKKHPKNWTRKSASKTRLAHENKDVSFEYFTAHSFADEGASAKVDVSLNGRVVTTLKDGVTLYQPLFEKLKTAALKWVDDVEKRKNDRWLASARKIIGGFK